MSVFHDKKFESMDWISQATEPYELDVNFVLAEAPLEIDVTFGDVYRQLGDMKVSIDVYNVTNRALKSYMSQLRWDDAQYLRESYGIEFDSNTEINFMDKTITPPIKLIKNRFHADESFVLSIMRNAFWSIANCHFTSTRMEYLAELAKLFLSEETLKHHIYSNHNRINNDKIHFVMEKIWYEYLQPLNRIRSEHAIKEFAQLLVDYISAGKEETLGNVYRIKIMIDNGQAIYTCGR